MENLNTNTFRIIGTLKSANVNEGISKRGLAYISVDTIIDSTFAGVTHEYEINFYTYKMTKDNKESKLYLSYVGLPELVNRKVDISGSLRENRYWSRNLEQILSSQQLEGRFVRTTADSTIDTATFELGGFVVKELVEKKDKNENIYRYDLAIGQANYNNTAMNLFTVHADPQSPEIVNGMRGYQVGDTVKVNGCLDFIVREVSVTDEKTGFGEPITRTYTNKIKNYYVTGGSPAIIGEGQYDDIAIKTLVDGYKAHDVALMENAKANAESNNVVNAAPQVTHRQTSLI